MFYITYFEKYEYILSVWYPELQYSTPELHGWFFRKVKIRYQVMSQVFESKTSQVTSLHEKIKSIYKSSLNGNHWNSIGHNININCHIMIIFFNFLKWVISYVIHRAACNIWINSTPTCTALSRTVLVQVDNINLNSLTITLNAWSLSTDEYWKIFSKTQKGSFCRSTKNRVRNLIHTGTLTSPMSVI